MTGWMLAASWAAALVALAGAVAAWRSAAAARRSSRAAERNAEAAEQTVAIERARRHEERAPQLRGEFHDDHDGARIEVHHDGGAVPDRVDLRATHTPPRCASGFADSTDRHRASFALTDRGYATLRLAPTDREDSHRGGKLVLDGTAEAGGDSWPVAVEVDVPDRRTGRAHFY